MVEQRLGRFGGTPWLVIVVLASGALTWAALERQETAAPVPPPPVKAAPNAGAHAPAAQSSNAAGKQLPAGVNLGSVMQQVHFAFRPEGETHVGGDAAYAISAQDGVVSLTASKDARQSAALRLETTRASRAGARRRATAEQRVDQRGALSIARGDVVETWTNARAGSEQAWRFASPPAGDGDLAVDVSASGLAYVGATKTGLHFADRSGLGFRYGHATWVDAAGARVEVAARYERGVIALRVPREVVDGAAYPVVLDPVVGPEFGIDQPVETEAPQTQASPAIAFGGDGYFVVWTDDRRRDASSQVSDIHDIYGARLNATGTVLDATGILISGGSSPDRPAVAFDGTNYLVAWQDSAPGDFRILAKRVSTSGTLLDSDAIPIATGSSLRFEPALAFDGTNYLVVWRDDKNGSNDVYAARLSTSGTLLDADGFALSTAASDQIAPAVAFDGTNYLVVWQDYRNGPADIYGTRVSPAGGVLDAAGIPLCTAVNTQLVPALAFDGTNYLVVWQDYRSGTNTDIYATQVSVAGVVLNTAGIPLSTDTAEQGSPAVAFSGTDFLVVWQDTRNETSYDLYGTRVSTAGVALDVSGVALSSIEDHFVDRPALAFDGTSYMIAWHDSAGLASYDVYGMRVSPALAALDASPITISTGLNEQFEPAVAFDGTNYLVVWYDFRNGLGDIYAARIDAEGTVLDPVGIALSTAVSTQQSPVVAFDGTNYLVVWDDFRSGIDGDIYATRVSTAGVVLDPAGIVLSAAAEQQDTPAVACDGTNCLVVWNDYRGSTEDIYGTRVSGAGAALDPSGIVISSAAREQSVPALAFDGSNYLVVWQDHRSGTPDDIYGARVSKAGVVLDATGIAISTEVNQQTAPAVAFNGTNYLVVWEDFRNGSTSDIYAARVSTSGLRLDAAGLVIANAANSQSRPTVVFDGRDSLVLWQDDRSDASTDAYAARVRVDGAVRDPNGFVVSAEDTNDAAPVTAFATDGVGLVFYERPDPELGLSRRIKARTLCSYGIATETACDGIDEDCDGVVDDDGVCDAPPDDDDDAGSPDDDAGTDEDPTPNEPEPGTGGDGAAGAMPGTMTHTDAGVTQKPDAGAPSNHGDDTSDAGNAATPDAVQKADSGCQCSIERGQQPLPFSALVFALIAFARLIKRRRSR